MAGKKGRSGRRPMSEECLRLRVLQKGWELADEDLNNPSLDMEIKRDIYLRLISKDIPTEFSGNVTAQVTQMPAIQKEYPGEANNTNRIAEYFIGSPPPPIINGNN